MANLINIQRFVDISTRNHEAPILNYNGAAVQLHKNGYCPNHPDIQLRTRGRLGGWVTVSEHCRRCEDKHQLWLRNQEMERLEQIKRQLFAEFLKPTKNWDQVRQWVQECPAVCQEKNSDGSLPLHCACYANAPLGAIQLLVAMWPYAVKEKNSEGSLPLHLACKRNAPLDVIRLLVEIEARTVHEKDSFGSQPLHYACAANAPLDVIQLLVETRPNTVEAKDINGSLPLHEACYVNSPLDIIKYLAHKCPQTIYAVNDPGYTPLAYAMMYGRTLDSFRWADRRR